MQASLKVLHICPLTVFKLLKDVAPDTHVSNIRKKYHSPSTETDVVNSSYVGWQKTINNKH